jgi:hypothetical protein
VVVLCIPGTGLGCSRHHGHRKVFFLGGTARGDGKVLVDGRKMVRSSGRALTEDR